MKSKPEILPPKPSAQTAAEKGSSAETSPPGPVDAPAPPPSLTPLQATLILAQRGNPAILGKLREVLDEHPHLAEHYGHLAGAVERSWLSLIAGKDLLITESVTRQLAALRQELAPQTPLEKLIVERIVAAWLQVQHAEMALASSGEEGLQIRQFRLKQTESAARRFHGACRNLGLVRRLLGGVELKIQHTHTLTPPTTPPASSPAPLRETPTGADLSPLRMPAARRDALFGGLPDPLLENTRV